ncbi:glycine oxidase ThiO [Micrococcoides hystricis]|uniref:glycine oxidase n=1 Tax=Micrococcoides hystricis TaxID=1572761 RepID=A0ABV6PAR3_9MICC
MNNFDVAIIGAGIIGQATAFHLATNNVSVALIDPAPATQASHAAAGMLAPIAEVQYQQQQLYPLMVAAGADWPELIDAVASATGRDESQLGYRHTETLVVGADSADRQYLMDLAGVQREHGMEVTPIPASAARRAEPALNPRLSAAVRIPSDHQVDPRIFLTELGAYFARPDVPVTHIEQAATGIDNTTVQLADGSAITANQIVVANGLGAADLAGLPALNLPLRPVHGDILRVRIPQRLQPLLTATVRAVVRGFPVYLVPRADGTMVIGATSREDDLTGPQIGGVYELLRDAQEVVPGVRECELLEVIARARPGTPDDVPLTGWLGPNLFLSTGYHRHGILLSALAARLTATELLGAEVGTPTDADAALLAAMNPHRFTAEGNSTS